MANEIITVNLIDEKDNILDFNLLSQTPKRKTNEWDHMWGKAVMDHGFFAAPYILLTHSGRLGLNAQQLMLLIFLLSFWWRKSDLPFPTVGTLANYLKLSNRQVQRHLKILEDGGYVKRIERFNPKNNAQTSNHFDFSGLVLKLTEIEKDVRNAKSKSREILLKAKTPKGLRGD